MFSFIFKFLVDKIMARCSLEFSIVLSCTKNIYVSDARSESRPMLTSNIMDMNSLKHASIN